MSNKRLVVMLALHAALWGSLGASIGMSLKNCIAPAAVIGGSK